MSGRISDGAELSIDGPWIITPSLPKGLPNPLRDGHPLPVGNALNLPVLFLIKEDLQSF